MGKVKIKTVALFLVAVMTISVLRVTPTYAGDADTLSFLEVIEQIATNNQQAKKDAIIDSKSEGERAGLWWQLRADGLAWNKIHNSVQTHIREVTQGAVLLEHRMYYGQDNEKSLWGKYGSADIIIQKNKKKYIYEVKPYSYTEKEKKEQAIKQLTAYVNCDLENNVAGKAGLKSGKYRMYTPVLRGLSVEFVTYDIEYFVEDSTGLIFYKFKRYGKGEKIPEYATEKVYVEKKEPARAKSRVKEEIKEKIRFDDDGVNRVPFILFLVATATAGYIYYSSEAKNPVSGNSVAATIFHECSRFLNRISRFGSKTSYTEADIREINEAVDDYVTAMEVCLGADFFDEAEKWLTADDSEKISGIIQSIRSLSSKYYEACNVQPPIDPLVIDLGASGIELHSMENGVYFDLDNNGFAERTAWIGTEDGFLALDRDENGKIENGGELFGDQIILANGEKSTSGFEALAEFDTNKDGKIDSNDEIFDKLIVWTDVNHNGISEAGELKSLATLGIKSISLEHGKTSITDEETGTRIADTAEVEIGMGTDIAKTSISEFWFPVNAGDTTHGGIATAGNIPEINRAIANDETGELETLFFMFCESKDIAHKRYLTRQILYYISGANSIEKNSRGSNMDAKELRVIEQFMGRKYEGVDGDNPNVNAAVILKELHNDIEEHYYTVLNMYAGLGGYLYLTYEYEDDNGENVLELSFLNQFFDMKIADGDDMDYLIYDLGLYLKTYDESHGTNYYDEYDARYSAISSHYAGIVAMTEVSTLYVVDMGGEYYSGSDGSDIVFGGDGDDVVSAYDGDDMLYGGDGNDRLYGYAGNDTLCGGKGNDILDGGTGNDTYLFETGDGIDEITDMSNAGGGDTEDRIKFGYGITPDSIRLERVGYDLAIYYGEEDKITVKYAYNYTDSRCFVEYIEFSDGTVWNSDDIASHMGALYGTEKGERIDGLEAMTGYSGNEVFYAGAGDDIVNAYGGDDVLYDEDGNDRLYSHEGNDILCGGKGNDTLEGGTGNDTYLFETGDGIDEITDMSNTGAGDTEDRIKFGYGITPDSIRLERMGYDLVIYYGEEDKITVKYAYNYTDSRCFVEYIEFSDGTVWNSDDIASHMGALYGTEKGERIDGLEAMTGYSGNEVFYAGAGDDIVNAYGGDDVLYGEDGNDRLYGYAGNDTLCGGKGNDTLEGGTGNDTYLFETGDGIDEITDMSNAGGGDTEDRIKFGYGITPDSIRLERMGYDLVIYYGEEDKITVKYAYKYTDSRCFVEYIEFSDGTVWNPDDIASHMGALYGTEKGERIDGLETMTGYSGNEVFYAGAGDDIVNAYGGDDVLYGEDGNDRLYSHEGNDILCGGKGNDTLEGGTGNDTYLFETGDGIDEITDMSNAGAGDTEDRIKFGYGITPDSIRLERVGYDLAIYYGEEDKITVKYAYKYTDSRCFVEYIEFSDGTLWKPDDIEVHLGVQL